MQRVWCFSKKEMPAMGVISFRSAPRAPHQHHQAKDGEYTAEDDNGNGHGYGHNSTSGAPERACQSSVPGNVCQSDGPGERGLLHDPCSMIPRESLSQIETLGSSGGDQQEVERGHGEAEGRRPAEDCCRWLKEVEEYCVCDLLLHLPRFLTKPDHAYNVSVGDTCYVIFRCEGI